MAKITKRSSHFDISATGTSREQRVSSFHCISNPRSPKCRKGPGQRRSHIHSSVDLGHPSNGTCGARSSHFGISATGTSREQRVSSFRCISNPRSPKRRKGPGQRWSHIHSSVDLGHPSNGTRGARSSHFRHFGYRDFERIEGLILSLHFKSPKPKTPKGSRPEAVPHSFKC
jgi:hypothetical protein